MIQSKITDISLRWADYCWLGEINVAVFPQMSLEGCELQVNAEDEEPHDPHQLQVAAWLAFIDGGSSLFLTLLRAVFEYYVKTRPQYKRAGQDWVEHMPILTRPDELMSMIRPSSVTIKWPYDSDHVLIGMSFGCDWEQEHGLGVVLQGMTVINIGGADCAIL